MKSRFTYAGAAGLLLTLGCGSKVEIGHGEPAGAGGVGATTAGTGGTLSQSGNPGIEGGETGVVSFAGSAVGGGASTDGPPADDGPQVEASKVDLLLAVDNSISMAEKLQLLAKTVPELVTRLVNPYCVNAMGGKVAEPTSPDAACPKGSQREFAPLRDLHVGVITSSLGSHGASGPKDVCLQPEDDDHAHLLPTVRKNVPSYDDKGFLKWDPDGLANPPGESDVQSFADSLRTMIVSAGEHGCGYEAQLESVYRFLVDPEPAEVVLVPPGSPVSAVVSVDTNLLAQRAAFLRPDSSVVVLMLTDENDCSIIDEGYGWLTAHVDPMYRATSACAANPNDKCCQSCAETTPNAGCPPIGADSECQKGRTLAQADDDLNLRCFDQKRRFGFETLYPTSRYVNGFGAGSIRTRTAQLVANPLFHSNGVDRDPSLFTLAVVGGVPWQDLATDEALAGDALQYLTAAELNDKGRWPVILGDKSTDTPPIDPFMRESTAERSGMNPITNDPMAPSTSTDPRANGINGHEQANLGNRDLQYACTFELPEPTVCDDAAFTADKGCDCFPDDLVYRRPVCSPPGGGAPSITQYYGKAYPALRELDVAHQLGRRTVLGSVCARNTQDETAADYGYRPVFGALGQRIAQTLVKQ
ncbi:MAG: hypothetical protein ABUL60_00990 [Myxococcales bacterium]